MASDLLNDIAARALENDSAIHRDVSKQLASLGKATHFSQAGDENVGLVIAGDRIALNTIDAVNGNPDLMAEWGLRASRPLGSDFMVYESTSQLDDAFFGRLIGSGLVEKAVSVFRNTDNGTEAVLLNEAIVSLKSGMTADRFFENRSEFLGYRPLGGTPDQFIVTLAAGYGEQALSAVNDLSSDPGLNWTAPNFHQAWQKYYFPNDPRFGNLWHLHNTGQGGGLVDADPDLPEAWDVIQGGSTSLVIGVVDDGVSNDHPDLNTWVNPGEIAGNGIDDDGNGWIDDINGWNFVNNNNVSIPTDAIDGHGTAVAGVAAARGDNNLGVTGASYNTRVLSARIFAGNSVATDAGIAEAIYYAAGRKRDGSGSWQAGDLSNHSWGGGGSSIAINDALTWATSQGRSGRGSLQVFAAGNSGIEVGYPATQALVNSGIAVVGAVNNLGSVSEYSSIGPIVDVVAPSNDFRAGTLAIDTTDRIGTDGYSADDYTGTGAEGFGGTSSAAPLATGITALAIARSEQLGLNLSPAQLRSLLRVNTEMLSSETYDMVTGKSYNSGYGRLNAASLVRGLGTQEISVQSDLGEITSGVTVYDAGSEYVGNFIDTTFRIRNQGTSTLDISSLTIDSGDFSILQYPADTNLALGETAVFTIRFVPISEAIVTRTVRVFSNDSDEAIFAFDIRGVGKIPNVAGRLFEDWDGDGAYDADDKPFTLPRVYLDLNRNGSFDQSFNTLSNSTPVDIFDNFTVTSTINASGFSANISELNVTINVTHTYVSDLTITLISPDGTRVPLAVEVGGGGDNFTNTIFDDSASVSINSGTAPFTGRFRPSSPLNVLANTSPNGNWILEVEDSYTLDEGVLDNWSITFVFSEPNTQPSATGTYLFDELVPGDYRVRTTSAAGFAPTTAAFYDFRVVQPTDFFPDRDFGFYKPGRFYGKVFDDFNANGVQGATESGVAGQFLTLPNTEQITSTFTSSIPALIPDLGYVISDLLIDRIPSNVVDVDVTVNIEHNWDEDIDLYLASPDGTLVELFTDVGDNGDNFTGTILDDAAATSITTGTAPFTGRFRPEGSLAAFNGSKANGFWSLIALDDEALIVGTLQSWSLRIVSDGPFKTESDSMGRAYFDLPDGAHTIGLETKAGAGWVHTVPSTGQRSVSVPGAMFNETYGIKQLPKLTVGSGSVSGAEGTTIQQTGTWFSAYGTSAVNLSASVGTVTKNTDGTWSWSIAGLDDKSATNVTITADDGFGGSSSVNFTYSVTNANPTVTVAQASVGGNVLSTLTNTGTWGDVPADTVSLAASLGTVTKNGDGTWAWSFTPSQAYTNQTVTITAADDDGGSSSVSFSINALVAVVNSKVYYKGSSFAGTSVDAALDTSKVIAKSGATAQALTFANLINTTR
ncbi:MAG: S8 family serine peptidase, partial [Planctomycetota bacterium]